MLAIALSLEGWSRKPRLRGKAKPAPPSSEVAEEERANESNGSMIEVRHDPLRRDVRAYC